METHASTHLSLLDFQAKVIFSPVDKQHNKTIQNYMAWVLIIITICVQLGTSDRTRKKSTREWKKSPRLGTSSFFYLFIC